MDIHHYSKKIDKRNPIFHAYDSEAVFPLEIGLPTMRIDQFDSSKNEQILSNSLDLEEERREVTTVRLAHYQQKLRQGYEKGVKIRAFVPGNLSLRSVVGSMKNLAWGKLGPNWE